ncbi:MAG: multifunctional CCA addition/repair protein [Burkholderiales bacterium]|nr:multifunctional CCA addition/repair protein [Burkholderiales bacterium]
MARRLPQPVRIYRVGGSVRDELLGRPGADRDFVVVGATPETMLASGFRPVGRDFPVFLHPETQEEYALARTERKHGRGYRGFEFFASPDVSLEEDLQRRDLTINAMAIGEDGTLVDPCGGAVDLAAGVLRHVSPGFAEDPLRVLRVARFAARLRFVVAPETEALLRAIVDSGELHTLAPERVWQELARGLMEAQPSRMLAVLRGCGALAALLPEVAALYGVPQPPAQHPEVDAGVHVALALDWAARHALPLPARYAVLAHDLGKAATPVADLPRHIAHERRSVGIAQRLSQRLRVPQECADAARLAARWHGVVHRAAELRPATVLDLLSAADALRRPERLATLLAACAADACSRPGAHQDYAPQRLLTSALAAIRAVDAGVIARAVQDRVASGRGEASIAKAIRSARLRALREWRLGNAARATETSGAPKRAVRSGTPRPS